MVVHRREMLLHVAVGVEVRQRQRARLPGRDAAQ